jgi:Tripartite tricarboxylate transporter TctB family.
MLTKHRDLLAGAFLVLMGVVMQIASWSIPRGVSMNYGADVMPKMVSALLALFGVAVVLQSRFLVRSGETKAAKPGNGKAVVLSLVFLAVYIGLLSRVGFIIMTALYLFAQTLLYAPREKRNHLLFAVISVVVTVAVYLIFAKGFKLILPYGVLG